MSRATRHAAVVLALSCVPRGSAAYLGLRNQGNTCYMNSMLQALHHLPAFRRAVYGIPTKLNTSGTDGAVPLGLQRVFYDLEHGESHGADAVGTEQLTDAFGWGPREVNVQQDVQEFARMLCEALSASMRAHGVEDAVGELFEGKTCSLTRCTRVDFKSEREERFYDLQLQVEGCRGLHAALRAFVREERLTGENKYNTRQPELGRQDARRSVRFKALPPVLQLHLKRFEYDATTGRMAKLQQEFGYPTTLRMGRYLAGGAAEGQPAPVYELHAVLSHVGDAGGGHYVSYVRPHGSRQWWEFDDASVRPVAEETAVRKQYGGRHSRGGGLFGSGAAPNAYMLVYVRRDAAAQYAAEEAAAPPALHDEVRLAFEAELPARAQRKGRLAAAFGL